MIRYKHKNIFTFFQTLSDFYYIVLQAVIGIPEKKRLSPSITYVFVTAWYKILIRKGIVISKEAIAVMFVDNIPAEQSVCFSEREIVKTTGFNFC